MCTFRALHRDKFTIKTLQDKLVAIIVAQISIDHVFTLKIALVSVFAKQTDMKNDSRLIWNMDVAELSGGTGSKLKIIASNNPEKVALVSKREEELGGT